MVAFSLPFNGLDGPIAVVGDFNGWDPEATLMIERGTTCQASVVVDAGRRYAFRYRTASGRWFNDEAAHDYEQNGFGEKNSVVDTTAVVHSPPDG
ncbi:MAG: isoamylase early set domain-containing protein [Pseudonocardiaceae bacterium]